MSYCILCVGPALPPCERPHRPGAYVGSRSHTSPRQRRGPRSMSVRKHYTEKKVTQKSDAGLSHEFQTSVSALRGRKKGSVCPCGPIFDTKSLCAHCTQLVVTHKPQSPLDAGTLWVRSEDASKPLRIEAVSVCLSGKRDAQTDTQRRDADCCLLVGSLSQTFIIYLPVTDLSIYHSQVISFLLWDFH